MKTRTINQGLDGITSALLVFVVGSILLLARCRFGKTLELASYDWSLDLSPMVGIGVLLATALGLGLGFHRLMPLTVPGVVCGGVLAFAGVACTLLLGQRLGSLWLIVLGAQVPAALLACTAFKSVAREAQCRDSEREREREDGRARQQAEWLDRIPDAVLAFDLDGRATYSNRAAERLLGWTASEVLGQSLVGRVFTQDGIQVQTARTAVLAAGEWTGELHTKTKGGATVALRSHWSLMLDDAGNPKSILVVSTDITDKKKLNAQMARTQRLEGIGTLARGVAHDFNNVLSPLMMGLELLQVRVPDETCRRVLKTMTTSAKRGADLIKQVQAFARVREGKRGLLQFGSLIREARQNAEAVFPQNTTFRTDIEEGLRPIQGDAALLQQALLHLCTNARDAMPNGGEVLLEARNVRLEAADARRLLGAKPMSYVRFSVTDTGTGIPPEIIGQVFDPFFTTKEKGKGAGLGLAMVFCIVNSHGGLIEVKSEAGKGTTVDVYLPAAENMAAASASAQTTKRFMGTNELVLVVDDEPGIAEIAASILGEQGFRVLTATNGSEALALCPAPRVKLDLAVVDMMMPGMDGPATVRALRKLQPGLRVVMITGMHEGAKADERFGDEQVTFLSKPFSIEQLTQTIHNVLASPTDSPPLATPTRPTPEFVAA